MEDQRDYAEEAYWRDFCDACGVSPCMWDGQPDGFHAELPTWPPTAEQIRDAIARKEGAQ